MNISVREFKANLSKYLTVAKKGGLVIITSHNLPIIKLVAVSRIKCKNLGMLAQLEGITWNGKKPCGYPSAPRVAGNAASDIITQNRQ